MAKYDIIICMQDIMGKKKERVVVYIDGNNFRTSKVGRY